jgi:hypothetical protein
MPASLLALMAASGAGMANRAIVVLDRTAEIARTATRATGPARIAAI